MGLFGFISDVCGAFADAFKTVADFAVGAIKGIADGIKGIVDAIGTEGLMIIATVALALIIPGFGLPELLSIIEVVGKIAQMLGLGGKDSPEELGKKMEIADKKPDDFETTEQYLKYLHEDVKLEPGTMDNLTPEEKVKYGLMGAALDIKALHEKYQIELSPEFLRDVTLMKMDAEEVGTYVKTFKENGINKMQDMTDYLRGDKELSCNKADINASMCETMKGLYPEMSDEQIQQKLDDMSEQLRAKEIPA